MMRFSFVDTRRNETKQACLRIRLTARVAKHGDRFVQIDRLRIFGWLVTRAGEICFCNECPFFSHGNNDVGERGRRMRGPYRRWQLLSRPLSNERSTMGLLGSPVASEEGTTCQVYQHYPIYITSSFISTSSSYLSPKRGWAGWRPFLSLPRTVLYPISHHFARKSTSSWFF